MKASNMVLEGNLKGYDIKFGGDDYIEISQFGSNTFVPLKKENVLNYQVITADSYKSGSSAIIRGAIGTAILGPVGMLAGLTAKKDEVYVVSIEWLNHTKSLLEIDKYLYNKLIRILF